MDWIVFDFDGTLTTHRSGWHLLHALFGTEHVIDGRATQFNAGELSFEEWAQKDVDGWIERGATAEDVSSAANAVKLSKGAGQLLNWLHDHRYQVGVLSGGLRDLTRKIEKYDPEFLVANSLIYDDSGSLVGVEKRVGPNQKGIILEKLGENHGFATEDLVFVGDSNSDIEAFAEAGTAILFDPDPTVRQEAYDYADLVLNSSDMTTLQEIL